MTIKPGGFSTAIEMYSPLLIMRQWQGTLISRNDRSDYKGEMLKG
jgi:hypothetical protein